MATTAEAVDTTQALLNVNMMNVTKLNSTNFITWSLQVHSLLDGYDLVGFLDGTSTPPDPLITVNNQSTTNPAFTKWRRQDKLIYIGLLGTLSPSIQSLVSKTKSAAEMWKQIAATYANPSWDHIQQLRLQLKQQTKGEKSVYDYMQGPITRFDQLSLLGKPVEHEAQIKYILGGLPEEYKYVAEQVEGREAPPSITEVHEKLLNKEVKLLSLSHSTTTTGPTSANVATSRQGSFPGKSNSNRPNQSWSNNRQQY